MTPCPRCGNRSHVIDSRLTVDTVRRRRECLECKHRWTTFEASYEVGALIKQVRGLLLQAERRNRVNPRIGSSLKTALRAIEEAMNQ